MPFLKPFLRFSAPELFQNRPGIVPKSPLEAIFWNLEKPSNSFEGMSKIKVRRVKNWWKKGPKTSQREAKGRGHKKNEKHQKNTNFGSISGPKMREESIQNRGRKSIAEKIPKNWKKIEKRVRRRRPGGMRQCRLMKNSSNFYINLTRLGTLCEGRRI